MTTKQASKEGVPCKYCGAIIPPEWLTKQKRCPNCTHKKMQRWQELMKEAKAKLDEEWPAYNGS